MGRPGGKSSQRVAALTDGEGHALDLRIAGRTFREIGEALGIPLTTARDWVVRALEKSDDAMAEKAGAHRELEAQRLDALLRSAWAAATTIGDDQPTYIDRVLRIMDRRAKLLGLDMPARSEVSGPDGGPVQLSDARAALVAALAGPSQEPEPSGT